MNTIGLGNALVDVLLKLENDDVLAEVGIQKGAMDMINQEQMIKIRKSHWMIASVSEVFITI